MKITAMAELETPARRYSRRKAARPGEIIAAALEEFHNQGFAKASLSRIAARAGVSRATLYLYFDDKDALFEAVAKAAMAPMIERLTTVGSAFAGTAPEIIEQTIRHFYSAIINTKNAALMKIIIAEGRAHPELVRRYHALISKGAQAALSAVIQRGIESGELRPGPVEQMPQVVVAPALMFMIHQMVFSDLETLDQSQFIEAHIDVMLKGIQA